MSPEFIKIPLRDLHRFGLDGMLQGYDVNWKHLQNRSPSSLHGKQHTLTKSQRVVLHLTMLHLASTKSADRHLIDYDCENMWLQNPGRTIPRFESWELDPYLQFMFIKFISRFGLELCCHPSGRYEDCFKPKALPVPDSTLQLCGSGGSVSGFSAPCGGSCCSLQMDAPRNPS